MSASPLTRKTLLAKVKAGDDAAWEEFYEQYRNFIRVVATSAAAARGCHLSDSDIAELIQLVLLSLWPPKKFGFDPTRGIKFRTWLSQVVRNKVIDLIRRRIRDQPTEEAEEDLRSQLYEQLEPVCDEAWDEAVLHQSMAQLREEVEPTTFEAFTMLMAGRKAQEVATLLGLKANNLYQIKRRCGRTLKTIYEELNEADEPRNFPSPRQLAQVRSAA